MPGPRPTRPISARYGRAQPFGQPVMRMVMSSSRQARSCSSSVLQRGDQVGQVAFAFRQREAAGRQRDAGHRIAPQRARPWRVQAVRPQQRLDRRASAPAGRRR